MSSFKYFKIVQNKFCNENEIKDQPAVDDFSMDLYNKSTNRINKYNFIDDFDVFMIKDLETIFENYNSFLFKQLKSVNAGFFTDYEGMMSYESGLLVSVSYLKDVNPEIMQASSKCFVFDRFNVWAVSRYGLAKDQTLTKMWRAYLAKKYDGPYKKAINRYLYSVRNAKSDTKSPLKIDLLINELK